MQHRVQVTRVHGGAHFVRRLLSDADPQATLECVSQHALMAPMIEYRIPRTNMFAVDGGGPEKTARDPEIDWTRVRRARPLDALLPATERWSESLPATLKPTNLVVSYPRVANRLAIAWQDPKAVQEVLDDVLIDRRGGRKGFPLPVQRELLRLRDTACGAGANSVRQKMQKTA